MSLSRRRFLAATGALAMGMGGLKTFLSAGDSAARAVDWGQPGFGPLRADPEGILDLPEGFTYTVFSRAAEAMDDGLLVPGLHDGMHAFPGPDGLIVLVRNHEVVVPYHKGLGPFGESHELLDRVPSELIYDRGNGGPCEGGTTNVVFDPESKTVVRHFLSLTGTLMNCCGGHTPRGSWISCEELDEPAGRGYERDHGYNFEVPARSEPGLVEPVPLEAMGRFCHEAVVWDPRTGVIYQTEDEGDGLFYRFLPSHAGELASGGTLQALCVQDRPGFDSSNSKTRALSPGDSVTVVWIDMEDVRSPDRDLRLRGRAAGAAYFVRGEGMAYGNGSVYFACTSGGRNGRGQIWRYTPSPKEGQPDEKDDPGRLELFIEPNDAKKLDYCDNVVVAPWGDLIVCEDGEADQFLVGVTPDGVLYPLARNALNTREFAGATFSPDGSILFANIQSPGLSLAITGPWRG